MPRTYQSKTQAVCVDLFCGAGGLTHGFRLAGLKVAAGIDLDPACRFPFETNNPGSTFVEADIKELNAPDVQKLFGKAKVKVLAGCAPCQPFSTYFQRYDGESKAGRWGLLYHFARLVREILPDVVTMENVPTVARHKVFTDFVNELRRLDYHVWTGVLDCTKFGVPQTRKRMVLLASRRATIGEPTATHQTPVTVRKALGGLEALEVGQISKSDPLHTTATLSPLNMKRMKHSRPGGTWRDWPKHLVAPCHRAATGQSYPGVYGRMEWDKPAPTITTQCFGFGNGRFGHPDQDRAISLREAALLQSFPQGYVFLRPDEELAFKTIGRLIGNAVPVKLGTAIGLAIKSHLSAPEQ